MDKSIKSSSSSIYVVMAGTYQFASRERLVQRCVLSEMLLWCIAGRGSILVNGRQIPFTADQWAFLPWARRIGYHADSSDPFCLGGIHLVSHRNPEHPIVFDVAHDPDDPLATHFWRKPVHRRAEILQGAFQPHDRLLLLAHYAISYFHQSSPAPANARSLAALFLDEITLRRSAHSPDRVLPGELVRLQDYIRRHLAGRLSVEDLARSAHSSPASISRLFRAFTGSSPSRWIAEQRRQRARTLLRTTALSVAEVAERVGFSDPLHFSRFFKKKEGLSPRHFRDRYRFF